MMMTCPGCVGRFFGPGETCHLCEGTRVIERDETIIYADDPVKSAMEKMILRLKSELIGDILLEKGMPPTMENVKALKAEIVNHIERAIEDFKEPT